MAKQIFLVVFQWLEQLRARRYMSEIEAGRVFRTLHPSRKVTGCQDYLQRLSVRYRQCTYRGALKHKTLSDEWRNDKNKPKNWVGS